MENGFSDAIIIILVTAFIIAMCVAVANKGPKFCPECGERYSDNVQYCTYDGCELLERRK